MPGGIEQRLGAWDSRRREAKLAASTIARSEQGPPVPYLLGRSRIKGVWIHHPWDRRAEAITHRETHGK